MMCKLIFSVGAAGNSGRRVVVEDGMVVYVAKRGERSPSDSHWLIPTPPVYVERVYYSPYPSYEAGGDILGLRLW